MKKIHIHYSINSMIAKKGNIGLRIDKIPQAKQGYYYTCFARGGAPDNFDKFVSMGFFGQLCRALTAFRRHIYNNFKHRLYDKLLFEFLFFLSGKRLTKIKLEKNIAHLVEFSPSIIKHLQNQGFHVILDVPIGPSSYMIDLVNSLGREVEDIGAYYMDQYERESFTLADMIVVPSDFVGSELVKIGVSAKKIKKIPFGVNLNDGYKRITSDDKSCVNFVFAGVASTRKGTKYLLEAWSDAAFKNDRLHLCGSVSSEVRQLISSLNLTNVITPGFIDTADYFKKCDVYVFPSLLEGSSKSIYEAMNASLPVIATYESGSIIEDGYTGFIIPKCDVNALKSKMILLKSDPELRFKMGVSGYEEAKKYSWERYSNSLHCLYESL